MKKTVIIVAMFTLGLASCDQPSKVNPYQYKAPPEIQKHFDHEVKWNAARQERWLNGELWVDSIGGDKCIVIRHHGVNPPSDAGTVEIR